MSQIVNRRHFVVQSGALAAGATMLNLSSFAQNAPSNRVTVGVMGLSRGRALAGSFAKQPGVLVKYVCDVDTNRSAEGAKLVEGATGQSAQPISDFRKILDDKEVDALICAAPNHWHAPATILACAAGKHVYVEKPCCHNPREGELMIQAARKHKRAVQTAQWSWHNRSNSQVARGPDRPRVLGSQLVHESTSVHWTRSARTCARSS
jgi:hypothetical protein